MDVRALELTVMPTGLCVVVEGPSTTEADRGENAVRLAEAHRAGRESERVVIDLSRGPTPRPLAAGSGPPELLPGRSG